jgi:hypothetical protein
MKLQAQWVPVAGTGESKWVAAAVAHEDGPAYLLAVTRLADGRWTGIVEAQESGSAASTESGFRTHSGAMAWCELKVTQLQGGGQS